MLTIILFTLAIVITYGKGYFDGCEKTANELIEEIENMIKDEQRYSAENS